MPPDDEPTDERHVWLVRAKGREPVGPVSLAQIAQAIEFGRLGAADDVRHVDSTVWEKVGPFMARMQPPTQAQVDATGQIANLDPGADVTRVRRPTQDDTSPGLVVRRPPLGGLFDFTFTTFFTPRIMGVLYGLVLLVAAGFLLACEFSGVSALAGALRATREYGEASGGAIVLGVALVLAGPVGAALTVLCGRVVLELIVVTFRISETLTEIKARTRCPHVTGPENR